MTMSAQFRIDGVTEVASDFAVAGIRAGLRARQIVKEKTDDVVETYKQLVPKDRPELVDVIHAEVKGTAGEAVASPQENPRVMPHMVEYGTYKDAPQPAAGPALDRHSGDFIQKMEEIAGDV